MLRTPAPVETLPPDATSSILIRVADFDEWLMGVQEWWNAEKEKMK